MSTFKPFEAVDSNDLHFDHPGGSTLLRQVVDFKYTDELTVQGVITVGNKRPQGVETKAGAQMIELTVRAARREEVPYRKYLASGAQCTWTDQAYANGAKGERVQATVRVAEVGPAPDGSGEDPKRTYTVKLLVIGQVLVL